MPEIAEPMPSPGAVDPGRRGGRVRSGRTPTGPIAVGAVLFLVGLLAIAVIMVLFATGAHDLPLWLNLAAMLAPVGFGIGLIGIFLEARSGRAARVERAANRAASDDASHRTPRGPVERETGQSA